MAQTLSTLTRCPKCLTPVYEGVRTCHHCGVDLHQKERRILNRRTVAFILLAVAAFSAGDAIYLFHEKRNGFLRDQRVVRGFATALLQGNGAIAREYWHKDRPGFETVLDWGEGLGIRGPVKRLRIDGLVQIARDCWHRAPAEHGFRRDWEGTCYRFRAVFDDAAGEKRILFGEACVNDPGSLDDLSRKILCFQLQKTKIDATDPLCCALGNPNGGR